MDNTKVLVKDGEDIFPPSFDALRYDRQEEEDFGDDYDFGDMDGDMGGEEKGRDDYEIDLHNDLVKMMKRIESESARDVEASMQQMPTEFYTEVDSFLSKEPPNFSSKSQSYKMSKGQSKSSGGFKGLSADNLPSVMNNTGTKQKATSKIKDMINGTKTKAINIDSNLLQEAFAYTDRLMREAAVEESEETFATQVPKLRERRRGSVTRGLSNTNFLTT